MYKFLYQLKALSLKLISCFLEFEGLLMKSLGIIPARWGSSRFEGKPLAKICGKEMICWVWEEAMKTKLDEIIVATDDEKIAKLLRERNIPFMMTKKHSSAISRIDEVSRQIRADFYVQINGDEPLLKAKIINKILDFKQKIPQHKEFVCNLISKITKTTELCDSSNIKIVFNEAKKALYMSRNIIPNPYARLDFSYYKHLGVLGYNKKALEFFANSKQGKLESIEGLETLRFIEANIDFYCIEVQKVRSLSVDTPKDLQIVEKILQRSKECKRQ